MSLKLGICSSGQRHAGEAVHVPGERVSPAHGQMRPTTLGLKALGNPNLIRQIEGGHLPSLRTAGRVLSFVSASESEPRGVRTGLSRATIYARIGQDRFPSGGPAGRARRGLDRGGGGRVDPRTYRGEAGQKKERNREAGSGSI